MRKLLCRLNWHKFQPYGVSIFTGKTMLKCQRCGETKELRS